MVFPDKAAVPGSEGQDFNMSFQEDNSTHSREEVVPLGGKKSFFGICFEENLCSK